MPFIESILFPVDFSASCIAMAAYVKRAASLLGAKVTLLHVVDLTRFNAMELAVRLPGECAQDHIDGGRERLQAFLAAEFAHTHAARLIAVGEPAVQIAKAARDGSFGLIIMPTHAGIFRQMLLGSTTAKVLNDADCPVLTGRHCHSNAPRPLDHREWLCAVGLSQDSARVLRFAAEGAVATRSRLCILHAVEPVAPDPALPPGLNHHLDAARREVAVQGIAELQRSLGTNAAVRIATGPAIEALLEAALDSDADLLILGRTPQPGVLGRMRDLTYAVIRDSPCPVLSV
jgi:nucleotide-binding universal stress UspA family protein